MCQRRFPMIDLNKMLVQASKFDTALRSALTDEERAIPPGSRSNAGLSYCKIALEHGAGIGTLLRDENPTAALSLVRLQYEAALRASWIIYAAPEIWLDRFSAPLADNNGPEPVTFPKVTPMLDSLHECDAAPDTLVLSLSSLKDRAWDAFNSYTHGGLRQMIRALNGYEPELLAGMIRTANSLSYLAAQLCTVVTRDYSCSATVSSLREQFPDCMHS